MTRYQGSSFAIDGRIAQMQPLDGVTKLAISVLSREPAADRPGGWKTLKTDVFGLSVEDADLRDYLAQSAAIGDLIKLEGVLSSTAFSSDNAPKAAAGIKFHVTKILCIPKRQADRLDGISPPLSKTPSGGTPPF